MMVSILVVGFVILGLFLSMLSSPPAVHDDDAVPFLPQDPEKLPQVAELEATPDMALSGNAVQG